MNPNVRSHHPSSAQLETLMEFLERNPGIAKGFLRTQNARERSRRQWEELAMRLNSIGGTIKTYKQWIKYWADKKSAIKKKVAARSAARHRTGGGVEDVVMLSEFEERVVALCGGESFSIGDAHLGMQPFPENDTPSPHLSYHEVQVMQVADTDNINLLQQQSQAPTAGSPAIVFYDSNMNEHRPPDHRPPDHRPISRKLFTSSSSTMGTSQCILQNNQLQVTPPPNPHVYHPSLSPPTITLTHTPTPSPSRRGSTPVASPVVHQTAAPTYSRHAASRHAASPSRRPRTVRGSRGGSVSRQTSSVAARPPSQRRTEFSTTTERFLRVEEQQLELQRLYAQILQAFLERSAERENTLIEAVAAVGKGLQSLAEAKNKD